MIDVAFKSLELDDEDGSGLPKLALLDSVDLLGVPLVVIGVLYLKHLALGVLGGAVLQVAEVLYISKALLLSQVDSCAVWQLFHMYKVALVVSCATTWHWRGGAFVQLQKVNRLMRIAVLLDYDVCGRQ